MKYELTNTNSGFKMRKKVLAIVIFGLLIGAAGAIFGYYVIRQPESMNPMFFLFAKKDSNNIPKSNHPIDINTTSRLRPLIPQERIVVSESGIRSRSDVEKLKGWMVNAVLVGEALVTTGNIQTMMRELII